MRDKLNENPIAQIAFVAVLLLACGYMLMTRVFGGSETEAIPPATASTAATTTPGATPVATDPAAVAQAPAADGSIPAAAPTTTSIPADGTLPKDFVNAYDTGDTVVLLVVRGGGIDDKLAADSVASLRSQPGVSVFVTTADRIARYSSVAQGVGLDRVPAVIALSPKSMNGSGPARASVSYSLQDPQSVEQAVRDARYSGPSLDYAPD